MEYRQQRELRRDRPVRRLRVRHGHEHRVGGRRSQGHRPVQPGRRDRDALVATTFDPIDVAIGQNGRLYALDAYQGVYVIHPETGALEQAFNLPYSIGGSYQDYRAITANAAGELFVATWGNQLHRFSATGVLQSSLTLPTASISNLTDIDLAADGTVAVGSRFGVVALTTEGFAAPTYITAGSTSSSTFVSFREDAPPPPAPLPGFSVSDATVTEGNSGTTTASFTVSLSQPLAGAVSVYYSTSSGTATSGSDFTSSANWLNFAAGETTKTVNITVNGDATYEPDEHVLCEPVLRHGGHEPHRRPGGRYDHQRRPGPAVPVGERRDGDGGEQRHDHRHLHRHPVVRQHPDGQRQLQHGPGTASSASDYTSTSGVAHLRCPARPRRPSPCPSSATRRYEPNETFYLNLSSPVERHSSGDAQGVGDDRQRRRGPADARRERRDRDRGEQRHQPGHLHGHTVHRQRLDRHGQLLHLQRHRLVVVRLHLHQRVAQLRPRRDLEDRDA